MGFPASSPGQFISLPAGGGALRGLGEKFSAELSTGAGRMEVPIVVPPGRGALQPDLRLSYSTGHPNSVFGLGWAITVPGVQRQTAHGMPGYNDDRDTFVLSGAEDLVPIATVAPGVVQYRPRTEGLFARILHRRTPDNVWEVATKDGLTSTYETHVVDPRRPDRIFAWRLTRTTDPFGNVIVHDYTVDEGEEPGHRWWQPLLRRISYADAGDAAARRFLVTVTFDYEKPARAARDPSFLPA